MSKNEFALFKKFVNKEQAIELTQLLKVNDIPFEIITNVLSFDISYANNATDKDYEIKIPQSFFEQANKLVEDSFEQVVNQFEGEHYLFDFTDDELYDILLKPDEWGTFDYKLAQKILRDRGKEIDKKELIKLHNQRLKELSKPADDNIRLISIGYLFSLVGGFLGIIIGYHIRYGKKTLPNGEKINKFSENEITQGEIIMYIGIIVFLFVIFLYIR
jgi:hypothetical protein